MKQSRINTRISGVLAEHIEEMCGEYGLYENTSEFIRDLIRQNYEKAEQEKWKRIKSELAPRINKPIEEFIEVDPEASLKEFKKIARARSKAK